MVVGLVLATPRGTIRLGTAPMSAAGPDLRQLVLGSEGTFGVITSVTVRIRPRPQVREFEGWRFDDFAAGAAALRRLVQDGPLPTVLRLSDEAETAINLADPNVLGGGPGGCLAVTGFEGTADDVAARRAACFAVAERGRRHAARHRARRGVAHRPLPRAVPARPAARCRRVRRDARDRDVLVEPDRPAHRRHHRDHRRAHRAGHAAGRAVPHLARVRDRRVAVLHRAVRAGRRPARPVAARPRPRRTRRSARAGATITHHHGVGTDHRATYQEEIGPLAVDVLRAVKASVDPAGILNPGVLVG